jgi:hypothetical protein
MSDVFQRVAAIHRERITKAEKTRLLKKKKLGAQQAYFKDTGIMEMWDDVKDIVIPNPLPEIFDGYTIPLSALVLETAEENINKTGLVLRDKNDNTCDWAVDDQSVDKDEQPKLYYRASAGKTNFCLGTDAPEAKKLFIDSFIKWLSKFITPQMLLDMNVDLEPVSLVKRSRKILQLAET